MRKPGPFEDPPGLPGGFGTGTFCRIGQIICHANRDTHHFYSTDATNVTKGGAGSIHFGCLLQFFVHMISPLLASVTICYNELCRAGLQWRRSPSSSSASCTGTWTAPCLTTRMRTASSSHGTLKSSPTCRRGVGFVRHRQKCIKVQGGPSAEIIGLR